ncbi:MAG: nucleotidyl transferase AbiEii/AbiGii toxin family protein [Anaerolineae bacterium]|nr:nucleotidyl transferase AbiEii/AbiGii toxin family protein [Anaerolineae bacterium]
MKEHLVGLIQPASSPIEARNMAREYLQALILQSLQRAGAMTALAFHGGTALRFLYSLPRFSEDLDFALEGNTTAYGFRAYLQTIQKDLNLQGYDVSVKTSDQKTVHSAFLRFNGLPYELDLSPHRDETLAVKVEVDTNPPKGAGLEASIVRRHVLLNLQHHNRASLLAGKLHAILQRPFLKGRDVYDLIWYLSDRGWPMPNLTLLNNALAQTNWDGANITAENWRGIVRARIESFSWEQVVNDVEPFLASQEDVELLTKENLLKLLADG